MQPAAPEISICPGCGRALEETHAGGLGCMPCLLRVGIGGEDDVSQDSSSNAFEGDENFGVYEIERREDGSLYELGHGAMGTTYRAIDTSLQRKVALKIIKIDVATRSAEARERFLREARAAAALRHDNIATVFQFGIREETGQCFYAMELIEGETLDERVGRTGPLDVRTTIDIARQVTSALAGAEKRGLIHRDLKPANLMLVNADEETVAASLRRGTARKDEKVTVKIIDFGLAKALDAPSDPTRLTHDGFVGTPAFASPEQFDPKSIRGCLDVRSDIYSLGVTLWFALTGKTPFAGHGVEDIHRAQKSNALPIEQLKGAHVPSHLRSLLKSMLALEPAARPGTHDLAERLQRCAAARGVRHSRLALAAALILILGASAFFIYPSLRHPAAAERASSPAAPDKSIAVLPFADLSPARDQEYFCDGIQEEILTRLSRIADLKVVSRTSTQRFKSAPNNLPQIAKQLGVAHILEGTVQRADDQVRVTVQLIKAENDSHLWSEKYDRKLTDIFAVESEIATKIAAVLQAKLTGAEQRAIATRPTENPEAHQLYLKGIYFLNKRTAPDLRTAIEYFERAIGKDPNYALAYAGLADAYTILSVLGGEGPTETVSEAKAAARKALQLDDTLPEAHNSLGLVLAYYEFDFAQSKKEFERAIELDPNYADAHHQFGNVNLIKVGEFDRAIAEGTRAVELDPLSLIINADLGQNYLMARRYDEAIEQNRKTLALDPRFYIAHWNLGEALQMKGQLREAIAEYEKTVELTDDPRALAMLAQGYAKIGETDKARNLLAQLEQLAADRYVGPFRFALVHLALGENEKALEEIERACREPADPDVINLKIEPLLDPLRGHPRFERLVARVVGAAEQAPNKKSIAVLPFQNLSDDKTNSDFANGVQDEILTHLAGIADLKVIGRTSVMQYKSGVARNVRKIGEQLGVAHLVEGSVQRAGNRVRVNAQLVDARTERRLWEQTYDRNLGDVFAIQSEIAKVIARQLQAKLSPREKSAIEQPVTRDIPAFVLYTRARNLLLTPSDSSTAGADRLQAADLLNQAVARDPAFFQAYCQLSYAHDQLYFLGYDHTPARLALAEAAIQTAFRLRPDAGETHLSRAQNLYWGYLDYDGALAELEVARQRLPNDARIFQLMGYIQRRRGQWEESARDLERAVELDPRDTFALQQMAISYDLFRRYAEEKLILDRVLAIDPDRAEAKVVRANVDLDWKADTRPLHQLIDRIRAENPAGVRGIANNWFICALAERDAAAARDALNALGETPFIDGSVQWNRPFVEGLIARMTNNEEKARAAFTAALAEQEKIVQAEPNYGPPRCVLGLINAALGRKERALREGRRAVELISVQKDIIRGPAMHRYLAKIAAWVGEKDLACEQLAIATRVPSGVSYGQLKLMPWWDPLRGDPRFEKIVASLAPTETANVAPERSIAVLLFENLSDEKEDTFFADGVHDDVLTKLAKLADLKVISRTSVMQYRGKHDLRQIGAALGVSHVLEGTVRRSDGKVRINARLADARTDTHVWAEEYDRNLNEVFAIEAELAQSIANKLRATVTARENLAMQERPTSNLVAYELYTRAKNLVLTAAGRSTGRTDLLQAVDLLNQAVARDPSFLLAYCQLASAHDHLYSLGLDRASARLELANAAIQAASRLRPDAGEVHLARAENLYRGYLDYGGALAELKAARQSLPNDARIFQLMGFILRRQGRWEEATQHLEHAVELDPRNTYTLQQMAWQYLFVRRYAEVKPLLARVLAIEPNRTDTEVLLASVDFHWKADIRPFHQMIDSIRARNPSALPSIADAWLTCALAERDPVAAAGAIVASGENAFGDDAVEFNRPFVKGLVARMMKNESEAQSAFAAARLEQEKIVRAQPNYGPPLCVLGLIDAALGRKEDALREGRRALELLPVEKDAVNGVRMIKYLAMIAAWNGDKDLACEQLATAASYPTSLSYGDLKLLPFWDPLRGDPRFEKIVNSLAPK